MLNIKKLFNRTKTSKGEGSKTRHQTGKKRGMSLRSKLLLMLLAAGITAVVTISYLGYQHGEQQLAETSFEQLTSLRASKQQQIEWYFKSLRKTVRVLGQTPTVNEAMTLFSSMFPALDNSQDDEDVLSEAQSEKLADYYNKIYFPKLDQLEDGKSNVEIFWPRSKAGQRAQSLYISENPNGVGEKDQQIASESRTGYDTAHAKYHDYFRNTMKGLSLYDLFLIDGETGDIVYTVFKETDFGTNLLHGPYAHSSLGKLFRNIRDKHAPGVVRMEDYKAFPPSYNAPAAFIGTAIYSKAGKFIGVLAAQFPIGDLNRFMTNDNDWKKSGLGESGEIYLIGEDKLMRSNSRFLIEDKENYLKQLATTHTPKNVIDKVRKLNTSVLFQRVDTAGVRAAFNGKTEGKIMEDYRGVRVLSSYAPLDIPDLHWVILAEIDEAEAREPQNRYLRNVLLTSGVLLLMMTLASLIIASNFLKPISVLIDGVDRIRKGEKNVVIRKLANDEFGELSDTFNIMTHEIESRDELIEQQSSSYDTLLNRIYPANIVQRLKKRRGKNC